MPTLYTADGASAVFETPEEVQAALASGQWQLPADGTVAYTSPTGTATQMSPDALAKTPGHAHYGVQDDTVGAPEALQGAVHSAYSGLGDQLIGAGEGAASVFSLGLSDLALDSLGADTALRKEHTVGRTVGEVAGMVATAVAPGLAAGGSKLGRLLLKTPGGAISKFGAGGVGALARVAHMAGEGAAYGVGQAISNVALAEPGMTAEQVISELGQGALLGGALGGVVGGIGIGAGKVAAARTARRGVLDLERGVAKEALGSMSKAARTVDEFTDFAAAEGKANAAEIRKTMRQVDAQVARPAGPPGGVPTMVTKQMRSDLRAAGHADNAIDQMTPLEAWQHINGNLAPGAAAAWAKPTSQVDVKLAGSVDEAVKAARGPAVNRYKMRAAFDLKPGEVVDEAAFKRLFKLADKQPEEFVKRVRMVGEYFESAKAAAANNPVAKARVADALSEFDAAIGKLVDPDTALKLSDPKVIGGILAAETGIEMLPDGPAKNMLRMGAAYKLLGGIAGVRGAGGSLISKAAKAIGRRYSAGYMSGVVRELPFVQRLSPQVRTGLTGAGASGGYELYNFSDRLLHGRAIKSAMTSEAQAQAAVAGAVNRLASGKPAKMRAMPAMNAVLDRLAGEPEGSKRSVQEKFKTVQDRLAKYAVAPDAAMASVYEMLKPLAAASEQLADMAEMVLGVQLDYLLQKMPRDPGTNIVLGKSMWQPTDRELYEFTACAMGVCMPLETIGLIADGLVPPQAAHALSVTNPELFTKFQMSIMERADEVRANSTYSQRVALGLAFQVPLEPTTDPRYVAFMQDAHAQKTMAQAAGEAGEANTPEESYSDAQKLLS